MYFRGPGTGCCSGLRRYFRLCFPFLIIVNIMLRVRSDPAHFTPCLSGHQTFVFCQSGRLLCGAYRIYAVIHMGAKVTADLVRDERFHPAGGISALFLAAIPAWFYGRVCSMPDDRGPFSCLWIHDNFSSCSVVLSFAFCRIYLKKKPIRHRQFFTETTDVFPWMYLICQLWTALKR